MIARMDGRVVLVTGGSSGIGRASALAFARLGASVAMLDVDEAGAVETQHLIEQAGGRALFVQADVSQAAAVAVAVARVVESFGRLDYAHNNAGLEGHYVPLHEYAVEDWSRVLAVNLTGVWLCMKHEIAHMRAHGGGAIVNTASTSGLTGGGNAAYTASKHGVIGLTKRAAREYAKEGIRVNVVCPSGTATPMAERVRAINPLYVDALVGRTPAGRLGEPEEVAEAVVWLCSDAASYVTGVALPVDGGFMAQ